MTSQHPARPVASGPVHILTDGNGRYFVPVYQAQPDGTAVYVGTAVYRDVTDEPAPVDVPAPRPGN
ncbi:hypothetical protein [Amycolatopsis sp. NPDC059021]|uniref:hypothetical protein n=1 Tax=Amycolatopsis sp. NPDC059021 TaxID=3346704 RepID=UPI003672F1E8